MTRTVISRLLWKDARSLAGLWLALVVCVVVMQGLGIFFAEGPRPEGGLWAIAIGVAAPMAFCFAAAAAGILFAGERELGTDEWLRVLPISPRTLAGSKLATGFVGVLAFLAATSLTALVVQIVAAEENFAAERGLATLLVTSVVGLCGLAAGVFFSVRMRSVVAVFLAAVIGSFVLMIAANLVLGAVLRRYVGDDLSAPLAFAALGVLDVWLAIRWADGRIEPSRFGREATARGAASRAAAWSLWLLRSLARAGSPELRGVAVQMWRELRLAVPVVCWIGGISVVLGVGALLLPGPFNAVCRMVQTLLLTVTPLVCGLAAAHDGGAGAQTFLGNKGVSPLSCWFSRQAPWLAAAAVLVVWHAVCFEVEVSALFDRPLEDGRFAITYVLSDLGEEFSGSRPQAHSGDGASAAAWLAGFAGLFALGQFCSFSMASRIMAACVSLAVSIVWLAWSRLVDVADVSLNSTAWLPVGLWMFATWRLMESWLAAEWSRRLKWRRTAWLVAPAGLALVLFSYDRRTSIPLVKQTTAEELLSYSRMNEVSTAATGEWKALLTQTAAAPPENDRLLLEFSGRLARFADLRGNELQLVHPRVTLPGLEIQLEQASLWIDAAALALQRAGRPEDELELYLDGVTAARNLAPGWPGNHDAATEMSMAMWGRVIQWANAEKQSAESLQRGVDRLRDVQDGPYRSTAADYAAIVDQFAARRGPFFDAVNERIETTQPWGWKLARNLYSWSGEYERTRRLARVISELGAPLSLLDRLHLEVPDEHRAIVRNGLPADLTMEDVFQWVKTTLPAPDLPPSMHPRKFVKQQSHRGERLLVELAAQRAAVLVAALQAHRVEHGEFPAELTALRGVLDQLPLDPLTGGDFEYYPHGLPATAVFNEHQGVVPRGQPVLLSRGGKGRTFMELPVSAEIAKALGETGDSILVLTGGALPLGRDRRQPAWLSDYAANTAPPTAKPDAIEVVLIGDEVTVLGLAP